MKKELLNSLKESDAIEESDFDIKNITDQREAIKKIKHYETLWRDYKIRKQKHYKIWVNTKTDVKNI